jgi:hypothetical protein
MPGPRTRSWSGEEPGTNTPEGYVFNKRKQKNLKGLSHEIFTLFWLEWIYLGLNGNCFWFLRNKDIPSILDIYFRY